MTIFSTTHVIFKPVQFCSAHLCASGTGAMEDEVDIASKCADVRVWVQRLSGASAMLAGRDGELDILLETLVQLQSQSCEARFAESRDGR